MLIIYFLVNFCIKSHAFTFEASLIKAWKQDYLKKMSFDKKISFVALFLYALTTTSDAMNVRTQCGSTYDLSTIPAGASFVYITPKFRREDYPNNYFCNNTFEVNMASCKF